MQTPQHSILKGVIIKRNYWSLSTSSDMSKRRMKHPITSCMMSQFTSCYGNFEVLWYIRSFQHRSRKFQQVAQIGISVTRLAVRWNYQKHRWPSFVFITGESLLKTQRLSSLRYSPWQKRFMFNQPHFAHMPEKCNSLFNRESWPLTDFHYMYTHSPLPGRASARSLQWQVMDEVLQG